MRTFQQHHYWDSGEWHQDGSPAPVTSTKNASTAYMHTARAGGWKHIARAPLTHNVRLVVRA